MRIISLSPSLTEIVDSLGRPDWLVGTSDHCPDAHPLRSKVGSPKALQFAAIERLRPEMILADLSENRDDEIRALQQKFKVAAFEVRSLEAVRDAVWELGRTLGKTERAREICRSIEDETGKNRDCFGGSEPVPAIVLFWHQPYLTVNFDTYASRLLEASGARNVFREESVREFPVELEDMIEKNPECLLLPGEPFPFTQRHVARFREYRVFSKARIELVDGKLFSRYGPRTAAALQSLRRFFLELRPGVTR